MNIDVNKRADLTLDLCEALLPFSSESCAIVSCEHVLEHVGYREPTMSLCKDAYRILKPGGIFSIGVPDTEWRLRAYFNASHAFFPVCKRKMACSFVYHENGAY